MMVHGHAWRALKKDFEELNEDRGSGSLLERVQSQQLPWQRPSGVIPVAAHAAQFDDSCAVNGLY